MGLIGKLIGLAATAIATKETVNKIQEKSATNKKELKQLEHKNEKEIKNLDHRNVKEIKSLDHKNELEKMTHTAKIQKSQFDQNGKMIFTKRCPNCGEMDTLDAKFCSACGSEMNESKVKCPHCEKLIPKGSKFCNHCGEKCN